MRERRGIALAGLATLLLLAGCGGDDDGGEKAGTSGQPGQTQPQGTQGGPAGEPVGDRGGKEAADAFKACFKEPGYTITNNPSPSPPGALLAQSEGYEVTSLLVNSEKGVVYGMFVNFFASATEREEATKKLKLDFGSADVPQADAKGSAVVTYISKQAESARGAVQACLG